MKIDLTHNNSVRDRVGYFVFVQGLDREGNECVAALDRYPETSGCNPFHWAKARRSSLGGFYRGHEFSTRDDALKEAVYATGSYDVRTVNLDTLETKVVEFENVYRAHETS